MKKGYFLIGDMQFNAGDILCENKELDNNPNYTKFFVTWEDIVATGLPDRNTEAVFSMFTDNGIKFAGYKQRNDNVDTTAIEKHMQETISLFQTLAINLADRDFEIMYTGNEFSEIEIDNIEKTLNETNALSVTPIAAALNTNIATLYKTLVVANTEREVSVLAMQKY